MVLSERWNDCGRDMIARFEDVRDDVVFVLDTLEAKLGGERFFVLEVFYQQCVSGSAALPKNRPMS
jgi:hypothetical protein